MVEVISNKFAMNRQSGMSLCNTVINEPQKGFEAILFFID